MKTSHPSAQAVTIGDLLSCIYETLQRPVTPAEFESFSKVLAKQVSGQFYRRLDQVKDRKERKKMKKLGVKRIDTLLGQTEVIGLLDSVEGGWPLESEETPKFVLCMK